MSLALLHTQGKPKEHNWHYNSLQGPRSDRAWSCCHWIQSQKVLILIGRNSQETGRRTGNTTHTSFSIQPLDHIASLAKAKPLNKKGDIDLAPPVLLDLRWRLPASLLALLALGDMAAAPQPRSQVPRMLLQTPLKLIHTSLDQGDFFPNALCFPNM